MTSKYVYSGMVRHDDGAVTSWKSSQPVRLSVPRDKDGPGIASGWIDDTTFVSEWMYD